MDDLPDFGGEPPHDLVDLEVEGVGVPRAEFGDEGLGGAGEIRPLAVRVVPRRVHDEAEDGAHVGAQPAPALAQPHNLRVGTATCDKVNSNLVNFLTFEDLIITQSNSGIPISMDLFHETHL